MNNSYIKGIYFIRYLTYLAIFLSSMAGVKDNKSVVYFAALFIAIIIVSMGRVLCYRNLFKKFLACISLECVLVVLMQYNFNGYVFIFLYIMTVDVFLYNNLKNAINNFLIIYLSLIAIGIQMGKYSYVSKGFMNFMFINTALIAFFIVVICIIKYQIENIKEKEYLNNQLKQSQDELLIMNSKLKEYADQIQKATVIRERNNIAAEIHDNVGHILVAIIMKLNLYNRILSKNKEIKEEDINQVINLVKKALEEVRSSVSIIKSEEIEINEEVTIRKLVDEFVENTDINVTLNISTNKYKLRPDIFITIYSTIKEALTNVAKHSNSKNATISLEYLDKKIKLSIRDCGVFKGQMKKGIGLQVMEERVEGLGGNIVFKNEDGFKIILTIPTEV